MNVFMIVKMIVHKDPYRNDVQVSQSKRKIHTREWNPRKMCREINVAKTMETRVVPDQTSVTGLNDVKITKIIAGLERRVDSCENRIEHVEDGVRDEGGTELTAGDYVVIDDGKITLNTNTAQTIIKRVKYADSYASQTVAATTGDVYCAICGSGLVVSTDGINFDEVNYPTDEGHDVYCDPEYWALGANDSEFILLHPIANKVFKSTDGHDWEVVNRELSVPGYKYRIGYSKVARKWYGVRFEYYRDDIIKGIYSSDGVNWSVTEGVISEKRDPMRVSEVNGHLLVSFDAPDFICDLTEDEPTFEILYFGMLTASTNDEEGNLVAAISWRDGQWASYRISKSTDAENWTELGYCPPLDYPENLIPFDTTAISKIGDTYVMFSNKLDDGANEIEYSAFVLTKDFENIEIKKIAEILSVGDHGSVTFKNRALTIGQAGSGTAIYSVQPGSGETTLAEVAFSGNYNDLVDAPTPGRFISFSDGTISNTMDEMILNRTWNKSDLNITSYQYGALELAERVTGSFIVPFNLLNILSDFTSMTGYLYIIEHDSLATIFASAKMFKITILIYKFDGKINFTLDAEPITEGDQCDLTCVSCIVSDNGQLYGVQFNPHSTAEYYAIFAGTILGKPYTRYTSITNVTELTNGQTI